MKIAISGSVGIGKSTLVPQLAGQLKLPVIEENYELFFEHKDKLSSEQLIKIFYRVMNIKRAKEIDYGSFITDRCPIDLFVLWLKKGLCLQEEYSLAFYEKCKLYGSEYNFIIFPPWGEIPLKRLDKSRGNSRRVLNPWIQLDNHTGMLGLAHLWFKDSQIINIPAGKLDQEQRLNFVLKQIKVRA